MHLHRSVLSTALAIAVTLVAAGAATAQEADPLAPAAVLGWVLDETHVADGISEEVDGVLHRRGPSYSYEWRMDDPRLEGRAVWTGNGNRFRTDPMFEVQSAAWELTNDGGRWVGGGPVLRGTGVGDTNVITLTGEGDYEGLTAHVIVEFGLGGGRLRGAIFPGEMPPLP